MRLLVLASAALAVLAGAAHAQQGEQTAATPAGFYPCEGGVMNLSIMAAEYQSCKTSLAPFAAQVEARRAELQAHPEEQGCLGKDFLTCLSTLSLTLAMETGNPVMFHPPGPAEQDINGKPVPQRPVLMTALVPGAPAPLHDYDKPGVTLAIVPADGVVTAVVVNFGTQTPELARTQADWDRTGVYELARAIMGPKCITEDRLSFYRAYDAMSKRMAGWSDQHFDDNYSDPGVWRGASSEAKRCGGVMQVGVTSGLTINLGSYGGSHLAFVLKPSS